MVEHLWIRIAELRQEAAKEEWEKKHPLRTLWLRRLNWLRIRYLLFMVWLSEREKSLLLVAALGRCRDRYNELALRCYLAITRLASMRPARSRVEQMRSRDLMAELEARGLAHSGCVERDDLIEALCGPRGDRGYVPLTSAEDSV